MTIKKMKIYLATDIDKEADWLTDMSNKGFHFFKYKHFFYYFEEDKDKSYIYQNDFQEENEEYFQLYEDAGWEHVLSYRNKYHYFRTEKNKTGDKKIYTDPESLKALYHRMLLFYSYLFLGVIVALIGVILSWSGHFYQKFVVVVYVVVAVIYIYLLISLFIKSKKNKRNNNSLD
jgi:hypothetical protein